MSNNAELIKAFYQKNFKPHLQEKKTDLDFLEYFIDNAANNARLTPLDDSPLWQFNFSKSMLENIVILYLEGACFNNDECTHAICILVNLLVQNAPEYQQKELSSLMITIESYSNSHYGPTRERAKALKELFSAVSDENFRAELSELWTLRSTEFDSYVQWLPREMLEDTYQFCMPKRVIGQFFKPTPAEKTVEERAFHGVVP